MGARLVKSLLGLALWLAGGLTPVYAAEISVVPSVTLSSEFDSNRDWSFEDPRSEFPQSISPAVTFNYLTEIGQLQGRLGLTGIYYPRLDDFTVDHNYQVNGRYRATPRLSLNLSTAYIVDTTLEEELQEAGLIISRRYRESIRVDPGVQYALTERWSAGLSYGYYQVFYEDPRFREYYSHRLSLGSSYLLNPRTTLQGALSGRQTRYQDGDEYITLDLSGGAKHRFSEIWDIDFMGGLNITRQDVSTRVVDFFDFPFFVVERVERQRSTTVGPLLRLASTWRWPNTDLSVTLGWRQAPSGAGTLQEYFNAQTALSHRITERLTGSLGAGVFYSDAISPGSNLRRLTYRVSPGLSYRLTRNLSLASAYHYGMRTDLVGDRNAHRHLVWLSLSYSYPLFPER
jgi:predicted porin